ncbi:macro domain-containing protein [Paenibacillus glucanolyticus]
MKIKVSITDKNLIKEFLYLLSTVSILFSIFSIVLDVEEKHKVFVGVAMIIILLLSYIIMWVRSNLMTKVEIAVDGSKVIVKLGNLFEETGYKVIGFNEYFDTIVDENLISENSLNGIYINNFVDDINQLDRLIEANEKLKDKIVEKNERRIIGKKNKYRLGSIIRNNDYLLTAFSKFDADNRAYLYMNDYINFLLNFWNEIDIIYSGKSVSIPLMGTGITRFKEYGNITDQELLELLIWSFKISRIKFPYPSKVTFIIHETKKDKINFYKLKRAI